MAVRTWALPPPPTRWSKYVLWNMWLYCGYVCWKEIRWACSQIFNKSTYFFFKGRTLYYRSYRKAYSSWGRYNVRIFISICWDFCLLTYSWMKCGLATKSLGRDSLRQDGTWCHCKIRNEALCHLAECSLTVFRNGQQDIFAESSILLTAVKALWFPKNAQKGSPNIICCF